MSKIFKEEGLSLVGIPQNLLTQGIFDRARRTGDNMILSKEDVLSKEILEEELKLCDKNVTSCGVAASCKAEILSADASTLPLSKEAVEQDLKRFKLAIQEAIQRRAEKFLEDAGVLIEKMGPKCPPCPDCTCICPPTERTERREYRDPRH